MSREGWLTRPIKHGTETQCSQDHQPCSTTTNFPRKRAGVEPVILQNCLSISETFWINAFKTLPIGKLWLPKFKHSRGWFIDFCSQSKVARLYTSSGSVLSWSLKWKAKNRSKVKSKKVSLLKKYPWATFEYNLNGIWMKTLEIPAQTGLLGIYLSIYLPV